MNQPEHQSCVHLVNTDLKLYEASELSLAACGQIDLTRTLERPPGFGSGPPSASSTKVVPFQSTLTRSMNLLRQSVSGHNGRGKARCSADAE